MFLRRLGVFFFEIIQIVVFAISIFLFLYLLILQPHKIKGASMEPNFHDGEYLLTDKLSYRFNNPERGDVIVFKAPPDYKDEFIKRIMGIPGDEISIVNNQVVVNNKPLDESYLSSDTTTQPGTYFIGDKVVKVPENSYIVFGDNRNHSFDSRSFGPITRDKITGRAWFVYWPVDKSGVIKNPLLLSSY